MKPSQFNRLLPKIGTDKHALELIYGEYYPKLVLHLRRRFGRLLSAEDVAEEVFLALMRSPPRREVAHPDAFLAALADHKAIDLLRKRHEEAELNEEISAELSAPTPFDAVDLRSDVREQLKQLDAATQEIVYMHIWEGYSLKEIADLTNIGYETVRKKTSRAYAKLKKLFGKGEDV